jgi:hypothetical protein
LNAPAKGASWFKQLVDPGQAEWFDYLNLADAQRRTKQYWDAAMSYQKLATDENAIKSGVNDAWCRAASSWYAATGPASGAILLQIQDRALEDSRKCIQSAEIRSCRIGKGLKER